MRILVVASTFPAHDRDEVPAFVRDQVLALAANDPTLQIAVLAPHDVRSATVDVRDHGTHTEHRFHYAWPRRAEKLAGRGIVPTLEAQPYLAPLVPLLFLGELWALLRLTRRWQPDVLYAHWFTPQAVVARWVSALTGVPFVFTTHASDVSVWRKVPWVGERLVRAHVRRARRFTAVSRRSMDRLRTFFDDTEWADLTERAAIIPMGVDLPESPSVAASTDRDGRVSSAADHAVLFIGRLAEKKGVRFLLEAFAIARESVPDLRLSVVGDGPLRADLEARAAGLGEAASAVTFRGYLTGQDKAQALADHAVFVVPSIITESGDAEGLPVALMEGLAAGRVCVATAESGADDFVETGVNGYVVPERDVVALARALVDAASLSAHDRDELGRAARASAEQFAWPTIAERHRTFLFAEKG